MPPRQIFLPTLYIFSTFSLRSIRPKRDRSNTEQGTTGVRRKDEEGKMRGQAALLLSWYTKHRGYIFLGNPSGFKFLGCKDMGILLSRYVGIKYSIHPKTILIFICLAQEDLLTLRYSNRMAMSNEVIKQELLAKLKQEHCFWSYNEDSIKDIPDDMLIEKTLLHLDLDDINRLFLIYPFKKIKRVWLDYLIPQEECLYTLNRFFAWYYFKVKKPDAYIKSMATRHFNKLSAWKVWLHIPGRSLKRCLSWNASSLISWWAARPCLCR